MIVSCPEPLLYSWLNERIGMRATSDMKFLGRVVDNRLVAVIGYEGWNGASVLMHVAGEGKHWMSRELLFRAFYFPWLCGCNQVLGLVPSGNRDALKLNEKLGFKRVYELPEAHPDGSLILMRMWLAECKWIQGAINGQEERRRTIQ